MKIKNFGKLFVLVSLITLMSSVAQADPESDAAAKKATGIQTGPGSCPIGSLKKDKTNNGVVLGADGKPVAPATTQGSGVGN